MDSLTLWQAICLKLLFINKYLVKMAFKFSSQKWTLKFRPVLDFLGKREIED